MKDSLLPCYLCGAPIIIGTLHDEGEFEWIFFCLGNPTWKHPKYHDICTYSTYGDLDHEIDIFNRDTEMFSCHSASGRLADRSNDPGIEMMKKWAEEERAEFDCLRKELGLTEEL